MRVGLNGLGHSFKQAFLPFCVLPPIRSTTIPSASSKYHIEKDVEYACSWSYKRPFPDGFRLTPGYHIVEGANHGRQCSSYRGAAPIVAVKAPHRRGPLSSRTPVALPPFAVAPGGRIDREEAGRGLEFSHWPIYRPMTCARAASLCDQLSSLCRVGTRPGGSSPRSYSPGNRDIVRRGLEEAWTL